MTNSSLGHIVKLVLILLSHYYEETKMGWVYNLLRGLNMTKFFFNIRLIGSAGRM